MSAVGPRPATAPAAAAATSRGPAWTPGTRLLVLGVGSRLRRDDALGPLVADALAAGPLPDGVAVRPAHGLVPELAVDLAEVDAVWFVDAAADPGLARPTWARVAAGGDRARADGAGGGGGGGHALDPAALLVWAEAWAGRAPEAWTLALPAADFGLGEGLSPRGEASRRAALADLRARWGREAASGAGGLTH